jgi:cytochrome P450
MALDSGLSMPFGFGRRGCPGASIGQGVVKAMVGAVVHNYRLSREAGLCSWAVVLLAGRVELREKDIGGSGDT